MKDYIPLITVEIGAVFLKSFLFNGYLVNNEIEE